MRFKSVRYLLPVVAIAAFGAVVACSGSDDSGKLEVTTATTQSAVVITMYAGDNGAPSGTAVGTLIAPNLVLTAGHNVAGKSGWKIDAVNANGQKAAGLRGLTYDWKNFGSDKSHPDNTDIAVIELDAPINIDTYPTIATSPIPDGAKVTRIRRDVDGIALSKSSLKAVTGQTFSAAPIGFPTNYFMATEGGETIDSGGALMDLQTNTIYGVVSGKGMSTNALYIARVDGTIGAGWVPQHVLCHPKTTGGKGGGADGGTKAGSGGGTTSADGGATTPEPPPSSCWGTACGGGKGGGGKGGGGGSGTSTGGKGGSTAGSTGGKGGSTAGTGTCEGGGKGGGGSGTPTGSTGGKGGSTAGGTTGGKGGSTAGSTTGTSNGGTTSGSTTGTSNGGTTSGSTTGTSNGGTTSGNSTGGSSTGGDTTGTSTGGGNSTGGASTSGTGGTGGGASTGGASTGGGGGGTCDGPECGGCDEQNPNCTDEKIDYGDCACGTTTTTGPIY